MMRLELSARNKGKRSEAKQKKKVETSRTKESGAISGSCWKDQLDSIKFYFLFCRSQSFVRQQIRKRQVNSKTVPLLNFFEAKKKGIQKH